MDTTRNQRTIAARATVEGFGYWEGRDVRLEFRPAEPGTGVVFVRRDLPGRPRIVAHVANRAEAPRRTTLSVGEARVEMIEHVMAALSGLEIDNCEVWTDQAEMPGCDGSSEPFVRALDAVGIVCQDALRTRRALPSPLHLGDAASWVEAKPCAATHRLPLRTGLRRPGHHRAPDLGAGALTPDVVPPRAGSLPHLQLKAEAEAAGPGFGPAGHLPRPVGLWPRGPDRQDAGSPTSASATRCWTWSAIWRCPAATGPAASTPTAAATGSTSSWPSHCWPAVSKCNTGNDCVNLGIAQGAVGWPPISPITW